ncbi:MAG TPA: right-handed parallel beta-helix repeat-containing protein, partial [Thermoanaerobaculia bacterium]|nr:right-handed parallel beta-helix repeat-containing protein [Thermoanaerobaculia bacterium]
MAEQRGDERETAASDEVAGPRAPRRVRRARERQRRKAARALAGAAAAGAALAAPAAALTFTVSNLNDGPVAAAGDQPGTLRQAIFDANALAGADAIDFQAGLTGTILLTDGQLSITDSLDIQGPGLASATPITVNANTSSRVFYLYNPAALLDVRIHGITITNGGATNGGGIIDFGENLILDNVAVTGNAVTGDGGGLWFDATGPPFEGQLTISDSVISGNTADSSGAGIYVEDTGGPVLIQNSDINGNFAGGSGGGIYLYDPDADVTIEDSTISGNGAGAIGGGVYLYSMDAGNLTIERTTVSGNTATLGGGLGVYSVDQPTLIQNSTISGNQAVGLGGGIAVYYAYYGDLAIRHTTIAANSAGVNGGGVSLYLGEATIANSIVGDNTAAADPDLATNDATFNLSFSLVETPGGAGINDNGGNVFSQDPQLGPLANNGGPTQT